MTEPERPDEEDGSILHLSDDAMKFAVSPDDFRMADWVEITKGGMLVVPNFIYGRVVEDD